MSSTMQLGVQQLWPLPLWSIPIVLPLGYFLSITIYNLFFHPLRRYPGPWWMAANRLPYSNLLLKGDVTKAVGHLHAKYGDVVRVTPNTLSYISSQAWADIYEKRHAAAAAGSDSRGGLAKDPRWYFPFREGDSSLMIAGDEEHKLLRKIVAPAFSERAVQSHEGVLRDQVRHLIATLRGQSSAASPSRSVDLAQWLTFLAVDVIGELIFAEPFGGLATGTLHPFLALVYMSFQSAGMMREMNRYPSFLLRGMMAMVPRRMMEQRMEVMRWAPEAVARRIALGATASPDGREDIMAHVIRKQHQLSPSQIEGIAITTTIAGSETVATALSGAVYLLCTHPDELDALTNSLRTDFATEDELGSLLALQSHEGLNAVLLETLRMYPPAPDFLYRTTGNHAAVIDGAVVPPRTTVVVNLWQAGRSETNFHRAGEFVPARWAKSPPAEFAGDARVVSKPFSTGPRDCVGQTLARAEMRMALAQLLWHFDLKLAPQSQGWMEKQRCYLVWEKGPLDIILTPREA